MLRRDLTHQAARNEPVIIGGTIDVPQSLELCPIPPEHAQSAPCLRHYARSAPGDVLEQTAVYPTHAYQRIPAIFDRNHHCVFAVRNRVRCSLQMRGGDCRTIGSDEIGGGGHTQCLNQRIAHARSEVAGRLPDKACAIAPRTGAQKRIVAGRRVELDRPESRIACDAQRPLDQARVERSRAVGTEQRRKTRLDVPGLRAFCKDEKPRAVISPLEWHEPYASPKTVTLGERIPAAFARLQA